MDTIEIERRITFTEAEQIMEVDFSEITFNDSADVKQIYGTIEKMLDAMGKKWYFVVNYENTRIFPDAWFQHAHSGGKLNARFSLGTVRINPDEPAREAIEKRKESDENFNPNAVRSREEAMTRIKQLKTEKLVDQA